MTFHAHAQTKFTGFSGFSLIKALIRADQAYRARQHMLSLSDELLDDVGLKRSDFQA